MTLTDEERRKLLSEAPKTPDQRYAKALSAFESSGSEYEEWCSLGRLSMACVETERYSEAETYAAKLEGMVGKYTDDWNYGNAIHEIAIVRGLVAYAKSDFVIAESMLLEAGGTPGSPQLNSFGPSFLLADMLLKEGYKEAVLKYIDLCRVFWKNESEILDSWRDSILKGVSLEFRPNLLR